MLQKQNTWLHIKNPQSQRFHKFVTDYYQIQFLLN